MVAHYKINCWNIFECPAQANHLHVAPQSYWVRQLQDSNLQFSWLHLVQQCLKGWKAKQSYRKCQFSNSTNFMGIWHAISEAGFFLPEKFKRTRHLLENKDLPQSFSVPLRLSKSSLKSTWICLLCGGGCTNEVANLDNQPEVWFAACIFASLKLLPDAGEMLPRCLGIPLGAALVAVPETNRRPLQNASCLVFPSKSNC